ncbi:MULTISPECIES: hypothetical protein [Gracilimonas]|jgi:hypothetical protein|uniref:Uncharacterized protein n=1 Tax=Gracilimonas sediminicola TaxID=2952158 RepID=A0A9X2L523_9BACT|nr:hypothetical protein [Gracilimonas sediminicola]MCP9292457.1 hypothetical protein [Gracilimonas sediminicola]
MNRKPLTKDLRTTIWGLAAFIDTDVNLNDFSILIRDKKNSDIKKVAVILIEAKQKLNRVILQ